MGRDKGLLDTGEGYWATRMETKLAPLPVFYSINALQWGNYSRVLPHHQLIIDSPRLPDIQGPLKGLLSVHEKFPDKDFLLVACDLQDLDKATIRAITEAYTHCLPDQRRSVALPESYDFFIYQDQGFSQPFAGIYTARGLTSVYQQAGEGRLLNSSLQSLLRHGRTKSLPIPNPASFRNYNAL